MKLLTNFFSSAATRFPVITIIVILGITGFFGYMTTQAEELDTGFGGEIDTPEIEAQGKLSDYFGGSLKAFEKMLEKKGYVLVNKNGSFSVNNDRFVVESIVSCLLDKDVDMFSVKPSKYPISVDVITDEDSSPEPSVITALFAVPVQVVSILSIWVWILEVTPSK